MKHKRHIVILITIVSILFLPLIAMLFSNEVQWSCIDFVVAGGLLITSAFLVEHIVLTKQHGIQKTLLILLVLLALLLFWSELAVGIFE